ncbi:putative Zn-dependent peptidase [Gracilibacillus halotolerans]|uniref:Putative Zn-dependent peptidase n=1 Tax=Gracilibacillus halotolerans TaxID=74386 RepID=A0A841RL84_9BACI|nr:pitrilysin family protein [Gracilibacillus halotolerans]MBB6511498.1 putative Zn-dependent peptidase [Gracilibacillus halotolerans]
MTSITEQVIKEDGCNIHLLHTKKFKTIHISLKFATSLTREDVTKRALLPYVIQQGTKSFPTALKLRGKLDEIYGAVLSIDSSKKGEQAVLTIRMEIPNEKYIQTEESLLDEAISLLSEILYEPKVENNGFDSKIVAREKITLKNKMEALHEDKMSLANTRMIEEMCKDEPYGLRIHGYEEDLETITPENLYEYYQKLLKEDYLDIFVSGDIEDLPIEDKLKKLSTDRKQPELTKPLVTPKSAKPLELVERDDITQAKLHFGYRTNITYDDSDYAALHVFNGIFGGFPSSKLFLNVREKHSLAYYAASRIESHKGLMFVFSGIAPEQYDLAKEIINDQMEQMVQGDFTEEHLEETKEMTINQLKETMDHPQGIIELNYQRVIAKSDVTPETLIKKIKQVTKDEVMTVAKKINQEIVYLLTSKEDADSGN